MPYDDDVNDWVKKLVVDTEGMRPFLEVAVVPKSFWQELPEIDWRRCGPLSRMRRKAEMEDPYGRLAELLVERGSK